ncbi:N-acetylglucosamine-6-sulfatase [Yeosuana aromativorans]|uniref:N-acetylglucosamine-6-sulfatase n=1 Tax=Yeosuana aromativorans TaxID=288019 RepID=A0A8J3BTP5_9FLAO|nr:sulfatase [Yeosuana aromativorans]GGK27457.1 N-acetylglucosamine-6-sulfatase [Yeosuana aromativorans]
MARIVFIVCLVFSLSVKSQNINKTPKRPNIIFILSDDHATNAISAYSKRFEKIAPTPNIDKLANEGALLTNVFSTNAICGPSRASILTGKYSHVNGYFKNYKGGYFNGSQWTYPKALKNSGYQTAMIGKWHLASEPQGFDYFKYHIDHGEQGVYWNPTYSENGTPVKEKGYATNITTDFALNWLNQRDQKKPFCLLLQYKAPHREWSPDKKYENLWDNQDLPFPDTFDDSYKGREQTAGNTHMTMDYFNRRDMKLSPPDSLSKKVLGKWLDYGNEPDEIVSPSDTLHGEALRKWKYQTFIKDYLATIKSVDDNIGRVLDYLKEHGLEENTIVIYSSDQGFFLGDHGWFDKRFMYEESMRMPFIIRYPNKIKPGTVVNDIITNIDMAPTVLDMAGVTIPSDVQGRSFFNNLKGHTPKNWRQSMYYHYYEYPQWHHVQPHYGIRTNRYKLIHFYYDVDLWELYDLKNDPEELNNLIDSKKYASIVEKLKKDLNELKTGYGNTMTLEELRAITDKDFGGLESHKKRE